MAEIRVESVEGLAQSGRIELIRGCQIGDANPANWIAT